MESSKNNIVNFITTKLYSFMPKLSISRAAIIFLSGTLAVIGVACNSDRQMSNVHDNILAGTTESNSNPALTPSATAANWQSKKVESPSRQPNLFDLALDKAYGAVSISESAHSLEDWNLVVSQWQEAIALMKAVPQNSPYEAIAKTKVAEYQRNLTYAQHQASRPIRQNPNNVIPEMPTTSVGNSQTVAVEAPLYLPQNQLVFRAAIKRRVGGIPVIDATFNGTQQFEMIVDTGASGTVLTQQVATALGVVPIATAKANTANAKGVEFPIGYINSIEIGGAVVKGLPVVIAPSTALETGLLGHDFFGNYDVTIKRDVVEFRPQ